MGHQVELGTDLICLRSLRQFKVTYFQAFQKNVLTDAPSVTECLEVLESFTGLAVEPGSSLSIYVDCFDKDTVVKELVTSYEEIRSHAVADEESSDVCAPDAMCVHSSVPAQRPRIDVLM